MDKDRIKGSVRQAGGATKETLGKLTNDPAMEAEGKFSKVMGSIQKAFGKAKDFFRKS